ncbi:transposase [Paraburkholderia sp. CNPSo 3274]|nr:transposase [Paraburkholderia sp. CNPSo 3274]MCP3711827.1 transposase [Paraburkholderia sp. CNPSo 3274]
MSINGLSTLGGHAMRPNPMASVLLMFGNRRRERVEILDWGGNGFWLFVN